MKNIFIGYNPQELKKKEIKVKISEGRNFCHFRQF